MRATTELELEVLLMGNPPGGRMCNEDGCDREARRGTKCDTHAKRVARGMPVHVLVKPRPKTPQERVFEAALTYANAESDEDYLRAKDNLRKSVAAAAPVMRKEEVAAVIRSALAKKRAEGVRLGRPSKVHPALVVQAVAKAGSVARAAEALRVSARTIQRALRRLRGAAT